MNTTCKPASSRLRTRLLVVCLFAALFLVSACKVNPDVVYPQDSSEWSGCPIIPSPEPWFKWGQRYIYDLWVNDTAMPQTYMNGYGGYYDDYIDTESEYTYRSNTWLSNYDPETISSQNFLRLQPYFAYFPWDTEGLTWYCKGIGSLIFDGELNIFDYPLVLGKYWTSQTTATISGITVDLTFEGKVIAYIPAGATSSDDIIVASGCTYTLPIAVADIPQPLAELGDKSFEELAAVSDAEAVLPWSEVKIPAGARGGENVTGYYVTQTRLLMGETVVFEQEVWKDVRGYVPVYNVYTHPPLVTSTVHVVKLARRWTGTTELD